MPAGGRKLPANSRSNDRWFQHLAIVVSDIDRAYAQILRAGATLISAGPQTLPAWNLNADGIRAVYFRDLDGHLLELIQFPPGKGAPRWQEKDRLFLGIDHTAIAAGDTGRSLAFYRDHLGLHVVGMSENWGIEQDRLSGVPGAHVRITTLRAAAAEAWVAPIADHLADAALGQVGEIFDGDRPRSPRGAPAQAWSVAGVLEAWWRLEHAKRSGEPRPKDGA